MGDLAPLFNTLAFVTHMSKKSKSTSPSAVQVKNHQEKISTEEKLDVCRCIKKFLDWFRRSPPDGST
jgi:hypothetical protein